MTSKEFVVLTNRGCLMRIASCVAAGMGFWVTTGISGGALAQCADKLEPIKNQYWLFPAWFEPSSASLAKRCRGSKVTRAIARNGQNEALYHRHSRRRSGPARQILRETYRRRQHLQRDAQRIRTLTRVKAWRLRRGPIRDVGASAKPRCRPSWMLCR